MMRYIVFGLVLFFLSSCSDKCYDVNSERIKADFLYDLDDCFVLEKLIVDDTNKVSFDHRPLKYKSDSVVSLIKKDYKLKGTIKKINFTEENQNLFWEFRKSMISEEKYDKLPLRFQKREWYRIWRLKGAFGDAAYEIFIYVKEDGEFVTFHEYIPGP